MKLVEKLKLVRDKRAVGGIINLLLGAMIVVLVFVAIAPVVANNVSGVNLTNFTNGSGSLFGLTTLFFVLVGIIAIIGFVKFRGGQ